MVRDVDNMVLVFKVVMLHEHVCNVWEGNYCFLSANLEIYKSCCRFEANCLDFHVKRSIDWYPEICDKIES